MKSTWMAPALPARPALLLSLFALSLSSPCRAASIVGREGHLRASSIAAEVTTSSSKVTPEDLMQCLRASSRFIHGPKELKEAQQLSSDFCAKTKPVKERHVICPHFNDAIELALDGHNGTEVVTAKSFCQIVEDRMLETRGATRVPSIGAGPLVNFTSEQSCEHALDETRNTTQTSLAPKDPADIWYVACLSQECGSALPSRTRWCTADHTPTHSAWVCELGRRYIAKELGAQAIASSKDICETYEGFVADLGVKVEAFEYLMHDDRSREISDAMKAGSRGSTRVKSGARGPNSRTLVAVLPVTFTLAWMLH